MLSALTASRCFDETEKGGGVVESPCTCGLQPNRLFGLCLTTTDCLNYCGCRSAEIFSSGPFTTRRGRYIGLKNYWTTLKHAWKAAHIVLAGDLNQLADDDLTARTGLVQIVHQPTRGTNILDRICIESTAVQRSRRGLRREKRPQSCRVL